MFHQEKCEGKDNIRFCARSARTSRKSFYHTQYSVRDFINAAADELAMKIRWEGQGLEEVGYLISPSGGGAGGGGDKPIVRVDPRYFRPTEVKTLLGDPTKAKDKLGWTPKISFKELVAEMVREDFKIAERDELVKQNGYKVYCHNE